MKPSITGDRPGSPLASMYTSYVRVLRNASGLANPVNYCPSCKEIGRERVKVNENGDGNGDENLVFFFFFNDSVNDANERKKLVIYFRIVIWRLEILKSFGVGLIHE